MDLGDRVETLGRTLLANDVLLEFIFWFGEDTMRMRHPSPAARAIRNNPAAMTTAPVARATRSPAGARRSTVMAAATTAIARRSMTPMTRRIAIRPTQH